MIQNSGAVRCTLFVILNHAAAAFVVVVNDDHGDDDDPTIQAWFEHVQNIK